VTIEKSATVLLFLRRHAANRFNGEHPQLDTSDDQRLSGAAAPGDPKNPATSKTAKRKKSIDRRQAHLLSFYARTRCPVIVNTCDRAIVHAGWRY